MSDELPNGAKAPVNGAEIAPLKPKKLMDGGLDPRVIGAATQFKKGCKGGPGRPKASPLKTATLRYLTPRKAYAVVEAQWRAATDPDYKPSTSAAEWLRDTGEGRPGPSTEEAPGTQIELIVDIL